MGCTWPYVAKKAGAYSGLLPRELLPLQGLPGYGHLNGSKTRDLPLASNDMDTLQENLQCVFDKPLAQSIKSRKKIAQADEVTQLAKELGVAL